MFFYVADRALSKQEDIFNLHIAWTHPPDRTHHNH